MWIDLRVLLAILAFVLICLRIHGELRYNVGYSYGRASVFMKEAADRSVIWEEGCKTGWENFKKAMLVLFKEDALMFGPLTSQRVRMEVEQIAYPEKTK